MDVWDKKQKHFLVDWILEKHIIRKWYKCKLWHYVTMFYLPLWGTRGPAPRGKGDSDPSAGRGGTRHWRPRCSEASGQTAGTTARCHLGHYLRRTWSWLQYNDPDSLTDDHELLALRHWLPGLAAGLRLLVVVAALGAGAELGGHAASVPCFSALTSLSSIKWWVPDLQRSHHFHHIAISATSKLYNDSLFTATFPVRDIYYPPIPRNIKIATVGCCRQTDFSLPAALSCGLLGYRRDSGSKCTFSTIHMASASTPHTS